MGIELDPAKFTPSNTRFQRGSSSIRRRFRTNEITSTPVAGVSYVSTPVMEEDDAVDGYFYFAKSCFLCREYRRAAHWLRDQNGKKSIFLRCYALYMVCLPFDAFFHLLVFFIIQVHDCSWISKFSLYCRFTTNLSFQASWQELQ